METDTMYLAIIDDSLDEIFKPEMRKAYKTDKKKWLATDKFNERTPSFCCYKSYVAYC